MKIAVVGLGYVGLTNAVLLAQNNSVYAVDLDAEKITMINDKRSPFADTELENFLKNKKLDLCATTDTELAFSNAEFVLVATPTNYDVTTDYFDTKSIEIVISEVLKKTNSKAVIVIRSTIPVGYISKIRKKFKYNQIIFCPEFLREGRALEDNLYPARIIVGENSPQAKKFSKLLVQGSRTPDVPVLFTNPNEAEAIKLFANTFLAMRVAFFNELDNYALVEKLDTRQIIDGICLDSRIGKYYNNPSFGYGGYCLPKDTKQLLSNYGHVPQSLISSVVESNCKRMDFLTDEILKHKPKVVGVHRLAMKAGSDNFRESSILGIMDRLCAKNIKVIIYEPYIENDTYLDFEIQKDLNIFKKISNIIVANRLTSEIIDVENKVFSRDIYGFD